MLNENHGGPFVRRIRTTIPTLLTAAALTACSGTGDGEPSRADGAAAAPATLPEGVIAQLKQEYPVLREARAPEPRPSPDANPEQVPERVRAAVGERVLQTATGGATFYANYFEGRRTASGIPFRQNQMVAAHRSFPFGTLLRVTNLGNDAAVNVRVVDRGPFGGAANQRRTIVDLSRRAANQLGFTGAGRAEVRVEVLEWGEGVPRTG
jgi:rare lipoprotein A